MITATIHKCEWEDDKQNSALYSKNTIKLPVKNRLEFLREVVAGPIDVYHHEPTGRDWVINDEGLLLGLPLNPFSTCYHDLEICGTIIEIHGILD